MVLFDGGEGRRGGGRGGVRRGSLNIGRDWESLLRQICCVMKARLVLVIKSYRGVAILGLLINS